MQEPPHEVPRPDGPVPPPPFPPPPPEYAAGPRPADATRRGVLPALLIFGAAILLHLVTLIGVKLSGDTNNAWIFLPEGLLVVVAALIAAIIVTAKLPPESRGPFWATGVVCMFLSFVIWGATCAVAL
ncbi:MAG: hypothetical protein JO306_08345 [Gemmatimonadetes bacterium]|nr:hypothetical protein [Gemmatimonadota bacterium]